MGIQETTTMSIERAESGVVTITLDRPPVNAVSPELIEELLEVVDELAEDPDARAILFRGANDRWCAGADLDVMSDHTRSTYRKMRRQIEIEDALERLEKPVVVAIERFALGGGCELALACDVRVMAENAVIGLPEAALGLLPGAGGTQRLTRLVGTQRAFWMMATGMKVPAAQALDWGLVNEVVPADQTVARAQEIAEQLASGATRAIGAIKRLVYECWGRELPSGLLREGDAVWELL
ncbi:MAG TPA: enoyl-CoA hydratase/isomerase family protein, partial [Gaiellaceae bacterium]|nr:enoyl-CoA hydratase/isomerase family protein [Gaiellaceae bacterium]